jgi:hypothetical protein
MMSPESYCTSQAPLESDRFNLSNISCTHKIMTKQEKSVHKKSRGRPSGRLYGETIPVRLTREMIATIDKWAGSKDMSRSEAVRALIERGLSK